MELITIYSVGRGGGYSKKSGNLIVNLKKVMMGGVIASTGLGAATHIAAPNMLIVCSALLGLCLRLAGLEKILLDPEHALVVYALFRNVNERSEISENDALTVATQVFKFQDYPALNKQRFDDILKNLERMKVVRIHNGIVTLLEEVRLKC
jgi:hypothetical protein